jgi:hypothetical protein
MRCVGWRRDEWGEAISDSRLAASAEPLPSGGLRTTDLATAKAPADRHADGERGGAVHRSIALRMILINALSMSFH